MINNLIRHLLYSFYIFYKKYDGESFGAWYAFTFATGIITINIYSISLFILFPIDKTFHVGIIPFISMLLLLMAIVSTILTYKGRYKRMIKEIEEQKPVYKYRRMWVVFYIIFSLLFFLFPIILFASYHPPA